MGRIRCFIDVTSNNILNYYEVKQLQLYFHVMVAWCSQPLKLLWGIEVSGRTFDRTSKYFHLFYPELNIACKLLESQYCSKNQSWFFREGNAGIQN